MKATILALLITLWVVPLLTWAQSTLPTESATRSEATLPAKMDLTTSIDLSKYNLNIVWTLGCGCLVLLMQFGFALVETGLIRAKNSAHTFAMVFMTLPLGALAFWVYGFALGWGNLAHAPTSVGWESTLGPGLNLLSTGLAPGGWGLMGGKGFFLAGSDQASVLALFFYMLMLFNLAATIPTGALAERWGWGNFCIYVLWVALPFGLYAHWVWGGGWLAQLGVKAGLGHGAVDFAGSGVVHCLGGVIALAGAQAIGPRIGKFFQGRAQAIPGHDLPMVMGGTLVLSFGWLGLTAGSTLSCADLRISVIVVNTLLAAAAGAVASMLVMWWKFGKPDPSLMCNGLLAGLVAITASCAFVGPTAAVFIGAVAGVLVVFSVFYWDRIGVDDPIGAISMHGVNGAWGLLAVGLFANGRYGKNLNGVEGTVRGLFYGDVKQLLAQLISLVTLLVFGYVMAWVWFRFSNRIFPLRASREAEYQGLDIPEMGALGYSDFMLKASHSVSEIPMAQQ